MPGDSHRELTYETTFSQEDLEVVLVPVWILVVPYDDQHPPVRLIINGQTGKLEAKRPWSKLKVLAAILGVLAAILLGVAIGRLT